MRTLGMYPIAIVVLLGCSTPNRSTDRASVKTEIERLLKIQEDAYGDHSPEAKKRIRETCIDSLVYVGGDNGGMVVSADFYVSDLADGYKERPHDKHFQIFEDMVVVTSLHQGYKIFNDDTLLLNSRSTKIFTHDSGSWRMAYVTYAPLPVTYFQSKQVDNAMLKSYEGEYQLDSVTVETISARDNKLVSTIRGSDESVLHALNDSTFVLAGYFGKSVFVKDKKGKTTHYYYEWPDGQRINFVKVK
jgi:hypothetical protein